MLDKSQLDENSKKWIKQKEFERKRLMHLAKKYAESKGCRKCKSKKDFKLVEMFEFGDPFMPSSVVLYCKKCKNNEVVAERPGEDAIAFAKKMKKAGYTVAPKDTADKLIVEKKVEELTKK